MYQWRITKYNPKNRDELGNYQKNEWTSIIDVGKKFDGIEFSLGEYLTYESAYIDAITRIMNENNVESIKIEALEKMKFVNYADFSKQREKKIFESLKKDMLVSTLYVVQIAKLALREMIWCKLSCNRVFVHFGYDFYMYIGSEQPAKEAIRTITDNILFVEDMVSPYA